MELTAFDILKNEVTIVATAAYDYIELKLADDTWD